MNRTLRTIGTAALTGLAWAMVWAPIAVLIGVLIVDPDNSHDEMWVAIGAYPGFLCGVLFSVLPERLRGRLGIDPVSRAGAWGAAVGLLVATLPVLALTTDGAKPLLFAAAFVGTVALLSALSAIAWSLLIGKWKPGAFRDTRMNVA